MEQETNTNLIPDTRFDVPKVAITAMRHATGKEPPLSGINFQVTRDAILIGAANGHTAVFIRLNNFAEAAPCAFSGNFDAVSALDPDEAECLTIRTESEQALLPMPYAWVEGQNGELRVSIDQPIMALQNLHKIDPERNPWMSEGNMEARIAVQIDRLDSIIKVAKAYHKGCSLEIAGQKRGMVILTIRNDPSFLGLIAGTKDPTGTLPDWCLAKGGLA
jgi:hypothetical protein